MTVTDADPRKVTGRGPALVAVAALLLLAVAVHEAVTAGDLTGGGLRLLAWQAACWTTFAVAAAAVRRSPVRSAVPLVVAGAIALQVVAAASPPRTTDDFYRYAWDGRVQAAGIDPYRYAPLDPSLAPLRDPWLFPPGCRAGADPCTRINRPGVPTIYPPVAQAEFTVVHLLTRPFGSDGGGARTWQVTAALLALAVLAALLRVLRGRGDPRNAVLWGWCPTVVLETGGGAHVDVLAALLVVGALAAASSGRRGRAGAVLGAAVATKVLPILLVPALLAPPSPRDRRARIRFAAGLVGMIAAVYLTHVLAVGPRVIGFLPGYLGQEGYGGSGRFELLQPWLPEHVAVGVGLLLVTGVALRAARTGDARRPWRGAVLVVGLTFALVGISYPWYPLLLVVLVALDGRAAWLAVAAAAYPAYLAGPLGWPVGLTERLAYGGALAVVASAALVGVRARNARRRTGTGQPSGRARGREEARHG
jgi:hypothetical protein